MNPSREDTLETVILMAERGHVSAQQALRRYMTFLVEEGKGANLPFALQVYLVRLANNLVPPHPPRGDTIRNMIRDGGIKAMVDVAAKRWKLPTLNGSRRKNSAAWYVAKTWTRHGEKLSERQVRRIYQDQAKRAVRLVEFLVGRLDQTF